jgi:hypothetical protein
MFSSLDGILLRISTLLTLLGKYLSLKSICNKTLANIPHGWHRKMLGQNPQSPQNYEKGGFGTFLRCWARLRHCARRDVLCLWLILQSQSIMREQYNGRWWPVTFLLNRLLFLRSNWGIFCLEHFMTEKAYRVG